MQEKLDALVRTQAMQLFRQQGLHFTMQPVAEPLHISKKTIYTVYPSKEALLLDMVCPVSYTHLEVYKRQIQGWQAHKTAKRYPKYGVQKGWERVTSPETGAEDFSEITDVEAKQLGCPF